MPHSDTGRQSRGNPCQRHARPLKSRGAGDGTGRTAGSLPSPVAAWHRRPRSSTGTDLSYVWGGAKGREAVTSPADAGRRPFLERVSLNACSGEARRWSEYWWILLLVAGRVSAFPCRPLCLASWRDRFGDLHSVAPQARLKWHWSPPRSIDNFCKSLNAVRY